MFCYTGDDIQSEQQQLQTQTDMLPGEVTELRVSHPDCASPQHQEPEKEEGLTPHTTRDGDGARDEAGKREQQEREEEEWGEKGRQESKATEGEVQVKKRSELRLYTSEAKHSSLIPISALNSPGDAEVNETKNNPAPSGTDHQEETDVYPTNSLLTLTEDSSLLGSGSPLTVAKAAAIQHLHRLASHYNIGHGSVSGSEASTNMRFSSASSKKFANNHSPQMFQLVNIWQDCL